MEETSFNHSADTSIEEGHAVMERVRQKIAELKWENDLVVTISGSVLELIMLN